MIISDFCENYHYLEQISKNNLPSKTWKGNSISSQCADILCNILHCMLKAFAHSKAGEVVRPFLMKKKKDLKYLAGYNSKSRKHQSHKKRISTINECKNEICLLLRIGLPLYKRKVIERINKSNV